MTPQQKGFNMPKRKQNINKLSKQDLIEIRTIKKAILALRGANLDDFQIKEILLKKLTKFLIDIAFLEL